MKKLILLLFIPLVFACGDSDKPDIKNDIDAVISYTNDRNWDKVMSYSFPEMFNFITKKQMIEFFESSMSIGMDVKPSNPTNFSISEPMSRIELETSSLPRKRSTPELHRQF